MTTSLFTHAFLIHQLLLLPLLLLNCFTFVLLFYTYLILLFFFFITFSDSMSNLAFLLPMFLCTVLSQFNVSSQLSYSIFTFPIINLLSFVCYYKLVLETNCKVLLTSSDVFLYPSVFTNSLVIAIPAFYILTIYILMTVTYKYPYLNPEFSCQFTSYFWPTPSLLSF